MTSRGIELPQGYAERPFDYSGDLYTEGQMRAAIEADRNRQPGANTEVLQQLNDVLQHLENEAMKLEAAYGHNYKPYDAEKARTITEKLKTAIYAISTADRKRRGVPVPKGWKLVPETPTSKQIVHMACQIKGADAHGWFRTGGDDWPEYVDAAERAYKWALSEAPQPAEPACPECGGDGAGGEHEEDCQHRSEPIGYIMPSALKQLKAGGNAIVGGVSQGCDVPIYTAPQPAEPARGEPVCFANINKQGDVTRTSKKRDGWAKTPLYTAPQPAERVKVPSAADLMMLAKPYRTAINTDGFLHYEFDEYGFAQAILARYAAHNQPGERHEC
jgi:hypothetical protein